MQKEYICECGKHFDNPQKFNGHKQGCEVHIILKYGSLDAYYAIKNRNQAIAAQHCSETLRERSRQALEKWISEQHTCEHCGKVMTEKYGSGRFCCRTCANSKSPSEETKQKIRESVIKYNNTHDVNHVHPHYGDSLNLSKEARELLYNENATLCTICQSPLPYERRHQKTCCQDCLREYFRRQAKENGLGGPSEVSSYGKRGTYKGIHCDSTYELAYLVYCIDAGIKIERCKKYFYYTLPDDDKKYKYYPDFYLPESDSYIELKGRDINYTQEKAQAMTEQKINYKLYHYEDMEEIFEYLRKTYGLYITRHQNNIYKLYDNT